MSPTKAGGGPPTIPTKGERNVRVNEWYDAVTMLDSLRTARQVAYATAKKNGAYTPLYTVLEDYYVSLARAMAVEPQPVFDHEAHIAMRIAEGHPDFVAAYGDRK